VLSHVATRFHLVGLGAAFGKLKTRRHGEAISRDEQDQADTFLNFLEGLEADITILRPHRLAAVDLQGQHTLGERPLGIVVGEVED
jgi:hypothetical protein